MTNVGYGEKGSLLVEMQIDAATKENNIVFPQKIKNRSGLQSMIPLLGIYPKNPKILI